MATKTICSQNSFLRAISTTVAPYAYSILCNRWMCEKLVFVLKLACNDERAGGSCTRSSFSVLMRRRALIHCSVYEFFRAK